MPASTGVRAAMEALRHLGARRVAMASPYPERHNNAMAGYLTEFGFEIVRAEGMDVPFKALQNVPPEDIQAFATSVLTRAGACDALYLPCPQWQAAQVVDALERERGVPDGRLYSRRLFCSLPRAGHHRCNPRPRAAAGVVGG